MTPENSGMPPEEAKFQAITARPEMQELAAGAYLQLPTPYDTTRETAAMAAGSDLQPGERPAWNSELHKATLDDERARFTRLIDEQPAAAGVLNRIRQLAEHGSRHTKNYGIEMVGMVSYEHVVEAVPDPADMAAGLVAFEDKQRQYEAENPGFQEKMRTMYHENMLTATDEGNKIMVDQTVADIAHLDPAQRAAAYEGALQELYGERWQAYKEHIGVADFADFEQQENQASEQADSLQAEAATNQQRVEPDPAHSDTEHAIPFDDNRQENPNEPQKPGTAVEPYEGAEGSTADQPTSAETSEQAGSAERSDELSPAEVEDLWRGTKLFLETDPDSPEARALRRDFGEFPEVNMNLDTGYVTDRNGKQHPAGELAQRILEDRKARLNQSPEADEGHVSDAADTVGHTVLAAEAVIPEDVDGKTDEEKLDDYGNRLNRERYGDVGRAIAEKDAATLTTLLGRELALRDRERANNPKIPEGGERLGRNIARLGVALNAVNVPFLVGVRDAALAAAEQARDDPDVRREQLGVATAIHEMIELRFTPKWIEHNILPPVPPEWEQYSPYASS